MINKVIHGFISILTAMLEERGIASRFKYDEDVTSIDPWRRDYAPIVNNGRSVKPDDPDYDATKDPNLYDNENRVGNQSKVLGLYSRRPLRKASIKGNNIDLQMVSKTFNADSDNHGVQIQNVFYGEVSLTVALHTSSALLHDTLEILMVDKFFNTELSMSLGYKLGPDADPIEDVEYNISCDANPQLHVYQKPSDLKVIQFDVTITGPVFIPFYVRGELVNDVGLTIYAFDRSIDPTQENIELGTLVATLPVPD